MTSAVGTFEVLGRRRGRRPPAARLRSTREAARTLRTSEHTARQHLKAVFAKVGVHSRDHLREVLTGGLR